MMLRLMMMLRMMLMLVTIVASLFAFACVLRW